MAARSAAISEAVSVWLACAGVCFLNPYFHRLPASWVEIYQMKSLPTIIKEHSRLDPTDWTGRTVLGFGAVYCVLLVSVPVRRIRVVWLLPVVWRVASVSLLDGSISYDA